MLFDLGYIYEKEKEGLIKGEKCKHIGYVFHAAVCNENLEIDSRARRDARMLSVENLIDKLNKKYQ